MVMLIQANSLLSSTIISLHTGQPIGQISKTIINPHKLAILGFYVTSQWTKNKAQDLVLLSRDIRDLNPKRVMVNSIDELVEEDDLPGVIDILEIKYELIHKSVRTEQGKRLGKVDDYVIDNSDFEIQKIYVRQSVFKSVNEHSFIIDRSQIIEVNDKQVIVADAVSSESVKATQQQPAV